MAGYWCFPSGTTAFPALPFSNKPALSSATEWHRRRAKNAWSHRTVPSSRRLSDRAELCQFPRSGASTTDIVLHNVAYCASAIAKRRVTFLQPCPHLIVGRALSAKWPVACWPRDIIKLNKEVTLIQPVEQQLFTILALRQHKIALIAAFRSVAVS